jgi:hypothetical protein
LGEELKESDQPEASLALSPCLLAVELEQTSTLKLIGSSISISSRKLEENIRPAS